MAYTTPATTGATLSAMATAHKIWQKTVDVFDQSADFFREFEGSGGANCIVRKDDTSKGRGQTLVFTNMSGLYKEPHHGDEIFEDNTDFEEIRINDYELSVDWLRHGVRYTRRAEEKMGLRGELNSKVPDELGKWMGRQKTEKLQMMYREKSASDNYVYAGNASSVDTITKSDVISYDDIQALGYTIKPKGGAPAQVGREKGTGRPIYSYCFVAVSDALLALKQDPTYRQAARDAASRGPTNWVFSGGFTPIDGHVIKEFVPVDHDGRGAVGSPQNPKAELGTAIATGTTAIDITGGGSATAGADTAVAYYKWFPEYTYKYIEGDTQNSDALSTSGDFYVIIYNPPGSTDAGKWGFYRCDTNNGNKLTMKNETGNAGTGAGGRLAASTSGVASTRIGDVTWDADKNTVTHDSNSIVLLANAKAVPIGYSILMGRMSAFRGYGMWNNKRSSEGHEGEGNDAFIQDVFVTSVFGQTLRTDRKDRAPGHITYVSAINYPGINIDPTYA